LGIFSKKSQIEKEEEGHKRADKDRLKKTKTKTEEFSVSQKSSLYNLNTKLQGISKWL
jgi:hypothetical protein